MEPMNLLFVKDPKHQIVVGRHSLLRSLTLLLWSPRCLRIFQFVFSVSTLVPSLSVLDSDWTPVGSLLLFYSGFSATVCTFRLARILRLILFLFCFFINCPPKNRDKVDFCLRLFIQVCDDWIFCSRLRWSRWGPEDRKAGQRDSRAPCLCFFWNHVYLHEFLVWMKKSSIYCWHIMI